MQDAREYSSQRGENGEVMVITLKGDPKREIPKNSEYCIEAFGPSVRDGVIRVAEGSCSKSIAIDLDPGKYVVVIRRTSPHDPKQIDYYWHEEFFVGVTEEQYQRFKGIRPRLTRGLQTSEGPRWHCPITGCGEVMGTAYAMVEHEAMHNGFDLNKPEDLERFLGPVEKASGKPTPPAPKALRT